MDMTLEVLISCMHQKDASIIQRTNIQSDVLVINQCDENKIEEFDFKNKKGENCHARIIYTKERGLSKSRNMAIRYAKGDICLICDDDEVLSNTYKEDIINAFVQYSNYDIIVFRVNYSKKKYPSKKLKIGYIRALKVSSVQIAFKRKKIIEKNICFNEKMGAGTGNGSGEENRFLYDCLNAHLQILYLPICIAKVDVLGESSWFKGYDNSFFLNKGWANKMIFGHLGAICYDAYFAVRKYKLYATENAFLNALFYMLKGTFQQR